MRDLIKVAPLRERKRRKKAQHPAGIEPTTSRVLLPRPVLYSCGTTAAPNYSPITKGGQEEMKMSEVFQGIVKRQEDEDNKRWGPKS